MIPISMSPPTTCWCCAMPAEGRTGQCPRAGYLPIPKKLARGGTKDNGAHFGCAHERTAFGTIVLHINAGHPPSAAAGAGEEWRYDPAGCCQTQHQLLVDCCRAGAQARCLGPAAAPDEAKRATLGYFDKTIMQADEGCDFDFMQRLGQD